MQRRGLVRIFPQARRAGLDLEPRPFHELVLPLTFTIRTSLPPGLQQVLHGGLETRPTILQSRAVGVLFASNSSHVARRIRRVKSLEEGQKSGQRASWSWASISAAS